MHDTPSFSSSPDSPGAEAFRPLIEGVIGEENRHPVFLKALTHNLRRIFLEADFPARADHVRLAAARVRALHEAYGELGVSRALPAEHYRYHFAPGTHIVFSPSGEVLGIAEGGPIEAGFHKAGEKGQMEIRAAKPGKK